MALLERTHPSIPRAAGGGTARPPLRPRVRRGRPGLAAVLVAVTVATTGASTVAGCRPADVVPRSLVELERMAFVPAGRARLPGEVGLSAEYGAESDLLVDRFEVSRDDWAFWFGAPPAPAGLQSGLAATSSANGTWPAFASHDEATELAARRGMRLPTAREWLWIAAGPRALEYPWGVLPRVSVANTLGLDLRRPVAVGTFEQGRSPQGCYDLIGNVAEWVSLDDLAVGPGTLPVSDAAAVVGGSFLNRLRPLFGRDVSAPGQRHRVAGEVLPTGTRGVDLGLRCVVDAEDYLRARADEWRAVPGARERLTRVGERWGVGATPLLERLVAQRAAAADGAAADGASTDRSTADDGPLAWLLGGARR